MYDDKIFRKAGIEVHDFEFPDGTCPDMKIIERFINLSTEIIKSGQILGVHCRAGLGRTGTLIACYLINKYG
jgi:cell division cycle 14